MKEGWMGIIVWLAIFFMIPVSAGESFDDPFLEAMSIALPLRNPLPKDAGGAVALYQCLFSGSALYPDDDVDSLFDRLLACNIYPTSRLVEGESTSIGFSDLYSIVLQSKSIDKAAIQLQCPETKLRIPICTDNTVAMTFSGREPETVPPVERQTTTIGSISEFRNLETLYDSQHPISDSTFCEYYYKASACIEFIQMAKLTAFLYPDMTWKEFEIILEGLGISKQASYLDNTCTLRIEPLNTGVIIYETIWKDGHLQSASICIEPSIVTTGTPTINVFAPANEGEMVYLYCPCVYIDLTNTWRYSCIGTMEVP